VGSGGGDREAADDGHRRQGETHRRRVRAFIRRVNYSILHVFSCTGDRQ
jgi:hypothetical protein